MTNYNYNLKSVDVRIPKDIKLRVIDRPRYALDRIFFSG